jgi:hypothetical protein
MAEDVQIKFGADIGGALAALSTLKSAVSGAVAPVVQLKTAFAETEAAIQHAGAAGLAVFKSEMQELVASRALSLRQALGFDIEYTARQSEEERARLEQVLANDAAGLADKTETFRRLVDLSNRSSVEIARDQARLAEAARHEADRLALPYRQAFDEIGAGWRNAVKGLIEGTQSFGSAATEILHSVERGIVDMLAATVSKFGAGPLAGLLGQPAPNIGDGVGDVLGNAVSRAIFGLPGQIGQGITATAAQGANTAALAANTAALTALTGTLGATTATSGASTLAATGAATAASSASGGGLFGLLGGLFAFARGGIVPSAAGGWVLPNFAGMTPALLHAREMVLPASISEGLQGMIAAGAAGNGASDLHLHFHGPSDAPAVERWFTGLLARNPAAIGNLLRSNTLTPRTL